MKRIERISHTFLFISLDFLRIRTTYRTQQAAREILYCRFFGFFMLDTCVRCAPISISTDFPIQFRYPTFYFLINRAFNDLNYWVLSRLIVILFICIVIHILAWMCEYVCEYVFLHFIYGPIGDARRRMSMACHFDSDEECVLWSFFKHWQSPTICIIDGFS